MDEKRKLAAEKGKDAIEEDDPKIVCHCCDM